MPRRSLSPPAVTVRFIDARSGEGVSITAYGATLKYIAQYVERCLGQRYSTTSLTDGRQKKRPF